MTKIDGQASNLLLSLLSEPEAVVDVKVRNNKDSEINTFVQLLDELGLSLQIKNKEENTMTIQWKKLINFDVPQKLWDLAEKIANERGWTTEAVICDAAEKYLRYVEEDPDKEMIYIQIPKSLYDRIETVGNKSVEREIEREMTEWVELVEEIYEDAEEEEFLESLLPPLENQIQKNQPAMDWAKSRLEQIEKPTQHYLVKYESKWADEMDIGGLYILDKQDKEKFDNLTENDLPLIHNIGTNQEIEYTDLTAFKACYTWTPITEEEGALFLNLIGKTNYGHFFLDWSYNGDIYDD